MPADADEKRELLEALVRHERLERSVPRTLELLDDDPLASAGLFAGDLLRALLETPGAFWSHNPALYLRFLAAVRAGALMRRGLPIASRMEFWSPLALGVAERTDGDADDDGSRNTSWTG